MCRNVDDNQIVTWLPILYLNNQIRLWLSSRQNVDDNMIRTMMSSNEKCKVTYPI